MGCFSRCWRKGCTVVPYDEECDAFVDAPEKRYVHRRSLLMELALGRVRLLRPEYLIDLFNSSDKPLPCRQNIPSSAFWDPRELRFAHFEIVAVSYCWLTKEHPDPKRYHLETLVRLLELFERSSFDDAKNLWSVGRVRLNKESLRDRGVCFGGAEDVQLGVFMDWPSLHQATIDRMRTDDEERSFSAAMKTINLWYAHAHTMVWCFEGLPEGNDRPSGYFGSGWTVFEQSVAGILTPLDRILHVTADVREQLLRGESSPGRRLKHYLELVLERGCDKRGVMMPPERFDEMIADKHFTNGADLEKTVKPKYRETFEAVLTYARALHLRGIGFEYTEAEQVLKLAADRCKYVTEVDLSCNDINMPVQLIHSSAISGRLRRLNLGGNARGTTLCLDIAPLADLTELQSLELAGTNVCGDLAPLAVLRGLEILWLTGTNVGGDVASLEPLRNLVRLGLGNTQVGGDITALASLRFIERVGLTRTCVHGDVSQWYQAKHLTRLGLGETRVSGDIGRLASLWCLEELDLNNTRVSGSLESLASIHNLTVLEVKNTAVHGNVAALIPLRRLKRLDVSFTGVFGNSEVLAGLRRLEFFDLTRTKVTGDWSRLIRHGSEDEVSGDELSD